MDKDIDGRVCTISAKDVEPFDVRRTIGDAHGLAEVSSSQFAVGCHSTGDLHSVCGICVLVVSGVELDLVVVQEDLGAFGMGRWLLLRKQRSCESAGGCRQQRAACEIVHGFLSIVLREQLQRVLAVNGSQLAFGEAAFGQPL